MCYLALIIFTGQCLMSCSARYTLFDTDLNLQTTTKTRFNKLGDKSHNRRSQNLKQIFGSDFDEDGIIGNRNMSKSQFTGDFGKPDVLNCTQNRSCSGKCHQTVNENHYCHCDSLCWFYGDCCLDYYASCLKLDINETDHNIMTAILSKLESYQQVLNLREAVKLIKMSACFPMMGDNYGIQLVNNCNTDPDTQRKFHKLHQKLNKPGQNANLMTAITKDEIVNKCQQSSKLHSQSHILETMPVSWNATYTLHFYNVFCAICNGVDPEDVVHWESRIFCKKYSVNITDYAMQYAKPLPKTSHQIFSLAFRAPPKLRKCLSFQENATTSIDFNYHGDVNFVDVSQLNISLTSNLTATQTLNEEYNNTIHHSDNLTFDNNPFKTNKDNFSQNDWPSENKKDDMVNRCQTEREIKEASLKHYKELSCGFKASTRASLCQLYMHPYFVSNKLYKNPHCMPCPANHSFQNDSLNFWQAFSCSKSICSCEPTYDYQLCSKENLSRFSIDDKRRYAPLFTPSFRIMFDFRTDSTTIIVKEQNIRLESKTCPHSQTFVPFYQQCQDIVCLRGWRLVDQTCVVDVSSDHQVDDCHKNVSNRSGSRKLAVINDTGTMKVTMRFRSILDIDSKIGKTHNKGNGFVHSSINEQSKKLKAQQNISQHSQLYPTSSNDQRIAKSDYLFDWVTVRSLWAQVLNKRGLFNVADALYKLSSDIRTFMFTILNQNLSDHHVRSEAIEAGNDSNKFALTFYLYNPTFKEVFLARINQPNVMANLTAIAHSSNFLLDQIVVSSYQVNKSASTNRSENSFTEIHDRNTCSNNELFVLQKFNVSIHDNGNYLISFLGSHVPLTELVFTTSLDILEADEEISFTSAEIGVCEQLVFDDNCTYVYFNRTDFVRYQNNLLVTKHSQNLTQYFSHVLTAENKTRIPISDLLAMFHKDYGQTEIHIYTPDSYILQDEGAYVCQDYYNNYNFTNLITFEKSSKFLKTAFTEQIATVISLASSITCIVAVLAVYALVPELRNLPGKIVMSLSSALLMAQTLFLFSMYPSGIVCQVYAAVLHAMWLSSFAWLAVMACHLAYVLYFQANTSSISTFKIFSALCWLLPFVLAITCFVLDKMGKVSIEYGVNGVCWIGNVRAMIYTFGVPLFTLLSVTLISAVFVVRAIRKSSEFRHNNTQNHTGERMQLVLCVNLSLLMGFNWVFYFIAVATDTTAMWTVFIVSNGSQGCFIFLCYVARKAVLSKLTKQLNICQGALKRSKDNQGSPTVSLAATKTTSVSRSPALSVKNLHLVVSSYLSPGSSSTPSPTRVHHVITL